MYSLETITCEKGEKYGMQSLENIIEGDPRWHEQLVF